MYILQVKSYSINKSENLISIYGLSQNPDTKDYVIVLDYAEGGNFYDQLKKNYDQFDWILKIYSLYSIIKGLEIIHEKNMVHRDFHTGNLLARNKLLTCAENSVNISDMGLCGEISNIKDETNIYGVMPYVAPEVLKGKAYTQAADIYSFGMIMYFVATGRQPFANYAHDEFLALKICNGIRPEINEQEIPKCYINLMKMCWDSNPDNRPNAYKVKNLLYSFRYNDEDYKEFEVEFKEAEKYRKANLSSIENNNQAIHPEAYYTSRLLNPFTKNLPKCDNFSVEVVDFTK